MVDRQAASRWYTALRVWYFTLVTLGLAGTLYAHYVEWAKSLNPKYNAACDLSPSVSCSRVFTSRYGTGFGLVEPVLGENHLLNQANTVYMLLFYTILIVLGISHNILAAKIQVILTVLANFASVYLAYVLVAILRDFCIVCTSLYIINFLLALVCIARYRFLAMVKEGEKQESKRLTANGKKNG